MRVRAGGLVTRPATKSRSSVPHARHSPPSSFRFSTQEAANSIACSDANAARSSGTIRRFISERDRLVFRAAAREWRATCGSPGRSSRVRKLRGCRPSSLSRAQATPDMLRGFWLAAPCRAQRASMVGAQGIEPRTSPVSALSHYLASDTSTKVETYATSS